MKSLLFLLTLICIFPEVKAWDGYNYEKGNYVDIEQGSVVREGNDIEIYDYGSGEYKTVEVSDFDGSEVEYIDPDTGETMTIDMD